MGDGMRVHGFLLTLMLLLAPVVGWGQPAAPAGGVPAGMTQAQFDALADRLAAAVAERLQKGGKPAEAAPEMSAEPGGSAVEGQIKFLVERTGIVLGAMPSMLQQLARIPGMIDMSSDVRGLYGFLALMGMCILAALAAEAGVARLLGRVRRRLAAKAGAETGLAALPALGVLLGTDALGLGAIWLVSYGASGVWFSDDSGQSHLAAAILTGLFAWRLYMFTFRIVLRPDLAGARLVAMEDAAAELLCARISRLLFFLTVIIVISRIMVGIGAPADAFAAWRLCANVMVGTMFVITLRAVEAPVAQWFGDLAGAAQSGVMAGLARGWLAVGLPFIGVLTLAQMYGSITARHTVPSAVLLTLNVVVALILFETVVAYIARRRAVAVDVPAGRPRPMDLVVRCVRVAVQIAAVVTLAQSWVVDVFGLVDSGGWAALTRSFVSAGVMLFLAFVAWEIVRFLAARYAPAGGPGTEPGASDEVQAHSVSRTATLVPLLKITAGVVIGVLTLFMVLSELGVNVTPLIAGASVLGLAVSFGSQTLVRDIVSGIFYLLDDAFRTGEYIDCGKAKGTVEGFTLRSLKLRHQSGQLHTIPFGQLGSITNFSRDYATVKFNLRFTRDTDLEKLRKVTKKIGQEMLEDPELKEEFLQPLKMMGVFDILDHALVVRFKFTVRPGMPSFVQRQAIKRMVATYPENGIAFANTLVAVQSVGGGGGDAPAAAAVRAIGQRGVEVAPGGA